MSKQNVTDKTVNIKDKRKIKQEKMKIIEPMIRKLHLTKDDVDAILVIDKSTLKHINSKVEKAFNAKKYRTSIFEPNKIANFLWSIGKSANADSSKLIQNNTYTVKLSGTQIMSCFGLAKSLYNIDTSKNNKNNLSS